MQSTVNQDAVVYCFTIIGEAIKQLNDALLARQPQIDWRGFAGFRDILIHQYHNTKMIFVWRASQEDLPALKAAVATILASLDESAAES